MRRQRIGKTAAFTSRPFLRRRESHSVVPENNGGFGDNWAAGGDNAVFADGFSSPRRPFLRRQESHSVVPATIGKNPPFPLRDAAVGGMWLWGDGRFVSGFWRLCLYDTVRFLPTQEWSAGDERFVGDLAIVPIQHCEIPAYAGMVCEGTGDLWAIWRNWQIGDLTMRRWLPHVSPPKTVAKSGDNRRGLCCLFKEQHRRRH